MNYRTSYYPFRIAIQISSGGVAVVHLSAEAPPTARLLSVAADRQPVAVSFVADSVSNRGYFNISYTVCQ